VTGISPSNISIDAFHQMDILVFCETSIISQNLPLFRNNALCKVLKSIKKYDQSQTCQAANPGAASEKDRIGKKDLATLLPGE
jgi:hypothetical protein